eukprot:6064215-Amphidinium_carterae.2
MVNCAGTLPPSTSPFIDRLPAAPRWNVDFASDGVHAASLLRATWFVDESTTGKTRQKSPDPLGKASFHSPFGSTRCSGATVREHTIVRNWMLSFIAGWLMSPIHKSDLQRHAAECGALAFALLALLRPPWQLHFYITALVTIERQD